MRNCKNSNRSGRVWIGLIILTIGVIFFLKNLGFNIPDWIVSWHTVLIALGFYVGFRHKFIGGGWLIMILVGTYFTLQDIGGFDFSKYYLAGIFIILGLYLILKPKGPDDRLERRIRRRRDRWRRKFQKYGGHTDAGHPFEADNGNPFERTEHNNNDILNSVNIFGGTHQNVYSKNFKGGDIVAIFGGCDLNLTQADFTGTITLDITAVFGGVKIIIPPTWKVKSEVVAILGGMDDKRAITPTEDELTKTVIIEGMVMFGGIDIRNF